MLGVNTYLSVLGAKGTLLLLLLLHRKDNGTCSQNSAVSLSFPQVLGVLVKVVDTTVYWKKFRERLGELTPRNLDHPVPDG